MKGFTKRNATALTCVSLNTNGFSLQQSLPLPVAERYIELQLTELCSSQSVCPPDIIFLQEMTHELLLAAERYAEGKGYRTLRNTTGGCPKEFAPYFTTIFIKENLQCKEESDSERKCNKGVAGKESTKFCTIQEATREHFRCGSNQDRDLLQVTVKLEVPGHKAVDLLLLCVHLESLGDTSSRALRASQLQEVYEKVAHFLCTVPSAENAGFIIAGDFNMRHDEDVPPSLFEVSLDAWASAGGAPQHRLTWDSRRNTHFRQLNPPMSLEKGIPVCPQPVGEGAARNACCTSTLTSNSGAGFRFDRMLFGGSALVKCEHFEVFMTGFNAEVNNYLSDHFAVSGRFRVLHNKEEVTEQDAARKDDHGLSTHIGLGLQEGQIKREGSKEESPTGETRVLCVSSPWAFAVQQGKKVDGSGAFEEMMKQLSFLDDTTATAAAATAGEESEIEIFSQKQMSGDGFADQIAGVSMKLGITTRSSKRPGRSQEDLPPLGDQQLKVLKLVQRGESVFITGGAGTGKSLLLKHIIAKLPRRSTFVTASTGLAALNIGGQTIHRFAGIGFGEGSQAALRMKALRSSAKNWEECRTLIIDEVSMISGSLLDVVDDVGRFVRHHPNAPFGGVQVIMCGDFLQLPPVTKGNEKLVYCFESNSWKALNPRVCLLTHVYRQSNKTFVEVLDNIRRGKVTEETRRLLDSKAYFRSALRPGCTNGDVVAQAGPNNGNGDMNGGETSSSCSDTHVFLRSRNLDVDAINRREFGKFTTPVVQYRAVDSGPLGAQMSDNCRAPTVLELRVGCRVMLLQNVNVLEGLANGTIGEVCGFALSSEVLTVTEAEEDLIDAMQPEYLPLVRFRGVHLPRNKGFIVPPNRWAMESGTEVLGARIQIPLCLAWAITMHKSQGMTLDEVDVDLNGVFAHGQAYVALSRCKTLEGLQVRNFIPGKIFCCPRALKHLTDIEEQVGENVYAPNDDDSSEDTEVDPEPEHNAQEDEPGECVADWKEDVHPVVEEKGDGHVAPSAATTRNKAKRLRSQERSPSVEIIEWKCTRR